MNEPTVLEIVIRYLDVATWKYGGLVNYQLGCACTKDNLAPCGDMQQECQAFQERKDNEN